MRGATVLPGLCDAHTHISWPLDFVFDHNGVASSPVAAHALEVAAVARTFLESGYTLIVGAGVLQPGDDVLAKDAIERGLIRGPRIVPSGLMITERGALGADDGLMEVAADAAGAARARRAPVRRGRACAKDVHLGRQHRPGVSVERHLHGRRHGARARSKKPTATARSSRCTHAARLRSRWPRVPASGSSTTRASSTTTRITALEVRRDDVWVCPGLHYLYAMVHGHAEPWGVTPEQVDASGYREEFRAQVDGLRKLRAAGIRIVAGGDFGHQWTRHGTYAAELQRYVELVDMTPVEAIHTATRNAAPLVGLDVGEIRAGALADLLVRRRRPHRRHHGAPAILHGAAPVIKDGAFAYVNPAVYP